MTTGRPACARSTAPGRTVRMQLPQLQSLKPCARHKDASYCVSATRLSAPCLVAALCLCVCRVDAASSAPAENAAFTGLGNLGSVGDALRVDRRACAVTPKLRRGSSRESSQLALSTPNSTYCRTLYISLSLGHALVEALQLYSSETPLQLYSSTTLYSIQPLQHPSGDGPYSSLSGRIAAGF